jgi:hypothetical protein
MVGIWTVHPWCGSSLRSREVNEIHCKKLKHFLVQLKHVKPRVDRRESVSGDAAR